MMPTTAPFLPDTKVLRVPERARQCRGLERGDTGTALRWATRLADGGLPPLVFVLVSTLASARTARPGALWPGAGDEPALLAVSKILLGWSLTALALVLTLAHLRRAAAGAHRPATPSLS